MSTESLQMASGKCNHLLNTAGLEWKGSIDYHLQWPIRAELGQKEEGQSLGRHRGASLLACAPGHPYKPARADTVERWLATAETANEETSTVRASSGEMTTLLLPVEPRVTSLGLWGDIVPSLCKLDYPPLLTSLPNIFTAYISYLDWLLA